MKRRIFNTLESNLDRAFKGAWFKKVSMEEKIKYLESLAKAEQEVWESCYREFPEVLKANTWSLTEFEMSWEDKDTLEDNK